MRTWAITPAGEVFTLSYAPVPHILMEKSL